MKGPVVPITNSEVMLLDAMPSNIRVFIFQHEERRMYVVLDDEWRRGGHPAIYNTPEEVTADFLHEAMHEISEVLDE